MSKSRRSSSQIQIFRINLCFEFIERSHRSNQINIDIRFCQKRLQRDKDASKSYEVCIETAAQCQKLVHFTAHQ